MQFDLSDIIFLVVVLSIAILLINNGGGGGLRARVPIGWSGTPGRLNACPTWFPSCWSKKVAQALSPANRA